MEPILDETTLVPCTVWPVPKRILTLAHAIQAFDAIGMRRVLRSVRDAADRDLGGERGLRSWCFDRSTPRDAGRLVATRLAAQPFIDGPDGLFAAAEGQRAVEARVNGRVVVGIGLAALTDDVVLLVANNARPSGESLTVELSLYDEDGSRVETLQVLTFAASAEVENERAALINRVDCSVPNGATLVERSAELFPRVLLGDLAREQIVSTSGTTPIFRQLIRHLRALDEGVKHWEEDKPYVPVAVTFSVESKPTLNDGKLGPLRDFPTPEGFEVERWSLHTKLTGGAGARLYFRPVRSAERAIVLVGYFGEHLPTVRYKT